MEWFFLKLTNGLYKQQNIFILLIKGRLGLNMFFNTCTHKYALGFNNKIKLKK